MKPLPASVVVVALAVLAPAAPAHADGEPRVVVVLDESVDGRRAPTSPAEIAVTGALAKEGWRLVAGDAADKLRRAQAVSMALTGSVPDVLSSLDADLVLLGQVDVAKVGTIEEAGLVGFRAAATAKLVRVDTAQIVEAFFVDARGSDFTDAGAAQKAARAAGEELAKAVRSAAAQKRARVVDLVVHGVPDRAQLEQLKGALARTKSVSNVVVRQSGKGLTKLEVSTSSDAEGLATELERAGVPLEVVQTSAAAILARHDVRRGVKLGVRLGDVGVKVARGAWLQGALRPLVEAELANVAWADVVRDGGDVVLQVSATSAGKAKDGAEQVALTLTVDDARVGGGSARRRLFTAAATGALDDVANVVGAAVEKLDEGFLPSLARSSVRASDGGLARALAAARAPSAGASGASSAGASAGAAFGLPELRIEALRLDSLFPAKLGHYATHPVGAVTVKHLDAKGAPATDVVVSVYVSRFMQLRTEIPAGTIAPGETKTIPLKVSLDPATVFAVEENTPTQAEVVVTYASSPSSAAAESSSSAAANGAIDAASKRSARRVAPLIVYGRRAIDWSEDEPITAFVTPQEENVRQFARAALDGARGAQAGDLPASLATAIAMFSALSSAELAYVKDPAAPARSVSLDTVQFARETLAARAGDCDDLSVLYASLLESVGVETAFVLVPGHVLLAVAADVLPDASERVTVDARRLLVHDGKAYVPVETTLLGAPRTAASPGGPATGTTTGRTFRDAWAMGAAAVARAQKEKSELIVVPTRAGWATYPPAALPRAAGLALPKVDATKTGAADEVKAVLAARDDERSARLAELAAAAEKEPASPRALAYAALLSRLGEAAKARAVLEAYVQKKPRDVAAQNNLANLDVLSGDAAAAVGRYRALLDDAALKSAQRRGDVLANLGLAYVRAGDTARAVDAFDAALAHGAIHVFVANGFVRTGTAEAPRVAKPVARADGAGGTALERDLRAVLERAAQRHAERAASGGGPVTVDAARFVAPVSSTSHAPAAGASGGANGAANARGSDADAASRARAAELLRWWS